MIEFTDDGKCPVLDPAAGALDHQSVKKAVAGVQA